MAVLALLAAVLPAAGRGPGIDQVRWLAGCWEMRTATGTVEERWLPPRGGSMIGVSRTVRNGRLAGYEMVVLREEGERLAYHAHPSGQPAAVFHSILASDTTVVFENPAHDFPQRVGYDLRGDSLLSWIEGTRNGAVRRVPFPYARVACER